MKSQNSSNRCDVIQINNHLKDAFMASICAHTHTHTRMHARKAINQFNVVVCSHRLEILNHITHTHTHTNTLIHDQ